MNPIARALIVATSVTLTPAAVFAAPDPLPDWAQESWSRLARENSLERSQRLAPATLSGDFDGDGKPDLAVLVTHRATRKEGIALLFGAATRGIVVGAGKALGHGGDDFSWMDTWQVRRQAKSPRAGADALFVAKSESASALIVLRAGKATWVQQGD